MRIKWSKGLFNLQLEAIWERGFERGNLEARNMVTFHAVNGH